MLIDKKHVDPHGDNNARYTIKDEMTRIILEWSETQGNFKELHQIVLTHSHAYKPIVSYLDGEALLNPKQSEIEGPKRKISIDVLELESEMKKF